MKKASAASVAPVISCLLLAGIRSSDAEIDTITVPYGDIDFVLNHYEDGRSSPYAVLFSENVVGGKSVYRFAKDGFVTDIQADDEWYKLVYDSDGDLEKVKRTSSRRKLAHHLEEGGSDKKVERISSRRKLVDQTHEDDAGKIVKDTPSRHTLVDQAGKGVADIEGTRTLSRGNLDSIETELSGADQTAKRFSSSRRNQSVDVKTSMKRTAPWRNIHHKNSEDENIADMPVENLASSGRQLAKEIEGNEKAAVLTVQKLTPAGRRRLYEDCEDCQQTWETVCGSGVETVCNLDGYGSPILSTAQASIATFCTTFGNACAELAASEVCDGQCGEEPGEEEEEEAEQECIPPFTITLEWSAGVEGLGGDPPLLELYVIEPGGQTASPFNDQTDMGVISSVPSMRTYTMFEGLDVSSGTFIAFVEWVEGFGPIDWTLVANLGDGRSVKTENGQFTGDCSASSTSSSTYSTSDHGSSRGTTRLMYVELFEYIDNGCQLAV